MAYEQRDMSGAIFKNDKKEKDTHPDYKGDARIDGVDYWVSVWLKEAKTGKKFMSLAFTRKEQQAKPAAGGNDGFPDGDGFGNDEDIPF